MTDITISSSGIRLAMSVVGSSKLPPVLFLHGMANSRDSRRDGSPAVKEYQVIPRLPERNIEQEPL